MRILLLIIMRYLKIKIKNILCRPNRKQLFTRIVDYQILKSIKCVWIMYIVICIRIDKFNKQTNGTYIGRQNATLYSSYIECQLYIHSLVCCSDDSGVKGVEGRFSYLLSIKQLLMFSTVASIRTKIQNQTFMVLHRGAIQNSCSWFDSQHREKVPRRQALSHMRNLVTAVIIDYLINQATN